MATTLVRPGLPLRDRYRPDALSLLPPSRRECLVRAGDPLATAWDVLYRLEPELFDRLIGGEHLHPMVLERIPTWMERAVEVGAGTGRLTLQVSPRCGRLVACEPVAPMRERLLDRLGATAASNVRVCSAEMSALPLAAGWADAVLACAVLTPHPLCGGEAGLAELERVCRPGGQVIVVWPHTPRWLVARGYRHEVFAGEMVHEFASTDEAIELATIFYPDRVADVARLRSRWVPYEVLGINAPRDLAWKVVD
jgi:SAM-dependent methyltransferase